MRSTIFPRKYIYKYTWISHDQEMRNQIDYVLIDAWNMSSLMYVRTMRGANMDSDHHLVKAIISARISNSKTIRQKKQKKINTEALQDKKTTKKFSERVQQLLEISEQQQSEEEEIAEQKWEAIVGALIKTAEEVLGMQRVDTKNDWFDKEFEKTTREKNQAYLTMQQGRRIRAMAERYRELRRIEKRIHKERKREHKNKKFEELESLQNQHKARKFYQNINNGIKEFKPRINMVRDRDGIIISDKCKIIDRWREYFSEILTIDPSAREPTPGRTQGVEENVEADEDVDVGTNENSSIHDRSKSSRRAIVSRVRAIEKLTNNRVPGEDMISAEILKAANRGLIHRIHEIIIDIWNGDKIPEKLNASVMCPLHKKETSLNAGIIEI